jgi:hypothetical protein
MEIGNADKSLVATGKRIGVLAACAAPADDILTAIRSIDARI